MGDILWFLIHDASLLAGALVLLMCVIVLVRSLMAAPELSRGAACGGCGYEISEVSSGRCAECGAHFLRAGLVTRAGYVRARGSLPLALLAWTIICLTGIARGVAYLESSWSMASMTPTKQRVTATVDLRPSMWGVPNGPETVPIEYTIAGKLDITVGNAGPESGTIEAAVHIRGVLAGLITVSAPDGSYVVVDRGGAKIGGGTMFDQANARAVFTRCGLDAANATFQRGADDLATFVQYGLSNPAVAGNALRSMGGIRAAGRLEAISTSGGSSPVTMTLWEAEGTKLAIGLGAGVVVYGAGCALIVWRRRRITKALYAPGANGTP